MSIPREYTPAILLLSGKALVVGGSARNDNTAEIYDPATASWTLTGPMVVERDAFPAAALLLNGKVLATGGYSIPTHASVPDAEIYDPASRQWTRTSSMSTRRQNHTATVLPNGQALVTGGNDGSNALSIAELYDPATGKWSATGPMGTRRSSHVAVLLANGEVLVAGGDPVGTSTELYNPSTGTWRPAGSLARGRIYGYTATRLKNGQVLVVGGNYIPASSSSATAELFDPATGTWRDTGTLHTPRSQHTASLLLDGRVLVAGGFDTNVLPLASAEIYDPATERWSPAGVMNRSREYQTATVLQNGQVLMAGGNSVGTNTGGWEPLAASELYATTPTTNVVVMLTNLSQVYDGSAKMVSVATTPPGIPVIVSYNDSPAAPTNAGTYVVIGLAIPPGYVGGASNTLVITKAMAAVLLTNLVQTFDGVPKKVTVATTPPGLSTTVTYNGSTNPPTLAGTYPVVATVNDPNYQGSSTATLLIAASQNVVLSNLSKTNGGAFQFAFNNEPGAHFRVLATTNLSLPMTNWVQLNGLVETSAGRFQFSDPAATNFTRRFYRAVTP
jgi:hypothetical protein